MGRLQVNMEGVTARPNTSWAVTGQFATAADITSVGALASILTTAFSTLSASTAFKAGIGTNFTLQRLHGLYYPTPGGSASVVADSSGTPFAGSATAAVPCLATVVTERTAVAGASGRGRSYWPFGGASGTDGSLSPTAQGLVRASWLAWHNAIIGAAGGAGLSPIHVVYSRKTGNMNPITGYCTGNRIDTARGRFGKDRETYLCDTTPAMLTFGPSETADLPVSALGPAIEAQSIEFASDPGLIQAGLDILNAVDEDNASTPQDVGAIIAKTAFNYLA